MKKNGKILLLILLTFLLVFTAGCAKKQPAAQTAQSSSVTVSAQSEETQTPTTAAKQENNGEPEQTPEVTEEPEQTPEVTEEPEQTPEATEEPEQTPEVTEEPKQTPEITEEPAADPNAVTVEEDGEYSDKEHVALYIHTYGHLPSNYITKNDARAAGWDSGAGNLVSVLPGRSIGGDKFGNYEGLLPEAKGRKYYECDINYNPEGKTSGRVTRGPERIIFSNDGLIFYTADHYETFEQLY